MGKIVELSVGTRVFNERILGLRFETEALYEELEKLSNISKHNFGDDIDFKERVKKIEIYLIKYALGKSGGNQAKAAKILKLKHGTLHDKIKRYKISCSEKNEEKTLPATNDILERTGELIPASKKPYNIDVADNSDNPEEKKLHNFESRLGFLKKIASALVEEVKAIQVFRSANMRNGINLPNELQRIEIYLIKSALQRTYGNQTKAARLLGIKLTTLNNKIKRFRLSSEPDFDDSNLFEETFLPEANGSRQQ